MSKLQIKKRDNAHQSTRAAALKDIVTEEETVQLNVVIPKSKRSSLKTKAIQEGKTVNQIVNQLLDEYLAS